MDQPPSPNVARRVCLVSDTQNKPYYLPEIRIEQSCEDGPDWFDLHITVVIGNQRIPFSRFRKNILEGNREYILPDGRIVLLPEEWFSKYANLLEAGKESDKTIRLKTPLYRCNRIYFRKKTDKAQASKRC